MHPVTKRYVFSVEYCCQPVNKGADTENCHGWVRYRSATSKEQLQRAFKDISDLPVLIKEIITKESNESE